MTTETFGNTLALFFFKALDFFYVFSLSLSSEVANVFNGSKGQQLNQANKRNENFRPMQHIKKGKDIFKSKVLQKFIPQNIFSHVLARVGVVSGGHGKGWCRRCEAVAAQAGRRERWPLWSWWHHPPQAAPRQFQQTTAPELTILPLQR